MGIIDVQGQIVGGQIWSKLEHIQDIMCVLITYQFKKNQRSLQPRIKYLNSESHGFRKEDFFRFPNYNPMGAIRCHGNQSSNLISPETYCSLPPSLIMLQIKFGCNRSTGCGDIHV